MHRHFQVALISVFKLLLLTQLLLTNAAKYLVENAFWENCQVSYFRGSVLAVLRHFSSIVEAELALFLRRNLIILGRNTFVKDNVIAHVSIAGDPLLCNQLFIIYFSSIFPPSPPPHYLKPFLPPTFPRSVHFFSLIYINFLKETRTSTVPLRI